MAASRIDVTTPKIAYPGSGTPTAAMQNSAPEVNVQNAAINNHAGLLDALNAANTLQNLSDAATVTWDYTLGNFATVTITANRTLSLLNTNDLDVGMLFVTQGVGNQTLSLPGIVATSKVFSNGAGQTDVLTFVKRGSVYFWDITNYGSISSLLTWHDLTFATRTNVTNTSQVFTPTTPTSGYGNTALETNYSISGDGAIRFQRVGSDDGNTIIGFNTTNAQQSFPNFLTGVFITPSTGKIYEVDNTSDVVDIPNAFAAVGDYVELIRTGSVLKIRKSSNGTTWTDIKTTVFTGTGPLYITMDVYGQSGKLSKPEILQ